MNISPGLILAGVVVAFALAGSKPAVAALSAAPASEPAVKLLQLAQSERNLKRRSLLECCWRSLRGQRLIGFYCSRKHLDQGLRRGQVSIVTRGGRRVCHPGY